MTCTSAHVQYMYIQAQASTYMSIFCNLMPPIILLVVIAINLNQLHIETIRDLLLSYPIKKPRRRASKCAECVSKICA